MTATDKLQQYLETNGTYTQGTESISRDEQKQPYRYDAYKVTFDAEKSNGSIYRMFRKASLEVTGRDNKKQFNTNSTSFCFWEDRDNIHFRMTKLIILS